MIQITFTLYSIVGNTLCVIFDSIFLIMVSIKKLNETNLLFNITRSKSLDLFLDRVKFPWCNQNLVILNFVTIKIKHFIYSEFYVSIHITYRFPTTRNFHYKLLQLSLSLSFSPRRLESNSCTWFLRYSNNLLRSMNYFRGKFVETLINNSTPSFHHPTMIRATIITRYQFTNFSRDLPRCLINIGCAIIACKNTRQTLYAREQ